MFRRRLIISILVITTGLGTALLLPASFGLKDAAVYRVLPMNIGEWYGRVEEVTKQEREQLDTATLFSKRIYFRHSPSDSLLRDYIGASLVISGDDMNNSIHRPERCLPSQGFGGVETTKVEVDVGAELPLTVSRLKFVRKLEDGTVIPALMYYWFVGADYLTDSHYTRTFYDMKYRIIEGTNQRWAYISLSTTFGDKRGAGIASTTEMETDTIIRDFIKKSFHRIHKTDLIKDFE